MTDLLSIYQSLKKKTWVDLSHQIDEKAPII